MGGLEWFLIAVMAVGVYLHIYLLIWIAIALYAIVLVIGVGAMIIGASALAFAKKMGNVNLTCKKCGAKENFKYDFNM